MSGNPIAIIPAYEPQQTLVDVAGELAARHFEVVVVDDGSSTASAACFDAVRACATVLVHDGNLGKGQAIKTGIWHVLGAHGDDCVIVTVDADGQHDPDDVVRVCKEARAHPRDLVIGSRSFDEKDVPFKSCFGNKLTRLVFRVVSGVAVCDTQTGLRAFSGELARALLDVRGSRYEYEMNVLMECARAGVAIREVGIRTIYLDGNVASHFNPVRDSLKIYREIARFALSSFTSFLIDYALFCVLLVLTGAPVAANIAARLVSATANYTLNRKAVFSSSAPLAKSIAQYAALAAFVLACNTLALGALVALGANAFAAKVAVELTLFAVSYTVQHLYIFRKERKGYGKAYLGNRV